ncbi:MAG: hypothetical protein QMC67_02945 [Candidatus Wallbacteria bacterium]
MSATEINDNKPKKDINLILKAGFLGILAGLLIFIIFLFINRENESSDEYLYYFGGIITSIDNFNAHIPAIYEQAGNIIKKVKINSTDEVTLKEREELYFVIAENINACKYTKKEIDKIIAPISAEKTKKDMIVFFDQAQKCLEDIKNCVTSGHQNELDNIKQTIEKLSKAKIRGYEMVYQ